jgi:hypothetical protein
MEKQEDKNQNDGNHKQENKHVDFLDLTDVPIQNETHYFTFVDVCSPHDAHNIRNPSQYIRSEISRLCKLNSIEVLEFHADDSRICIVTVHNDKKDNILEIARKVTSRLLAPPPKYALDIIGCLMLDKKNLSSLPPSKSG